MDAEKMTNVEMEELTPAEVQDKDTKNDELEGITAKNEEGEVEEKGAHVYSTLKDPTEEIYCLTEIPASTPKPKEDVYRRVRLYKWISVLLTVLSIVLLAVVFALAMKLSEVQSIQQFPQRSEVEIFGDSNCSRQQCQSMFPPVQAAQQHGHLCSYCGKGWIMFENTCYFRSKERLTWEQSRKACSKKDGHLVVIKSEDVQKFLTDIGGQLYWIGLRYEEKQQWTWVDDSALSNSYWGNDQPNPDPQGNCAFMEGQSSIINNWYSNPCEVVSQYICQKK